MSAQESAFQLDARLAIDTFHVGDLAISRVLLMDDARYPWLILVPRIAGACELIDLDATDQARLLTEINTCAQTLRTLTVPKKLNIAALGNVVTQLHVHIIARFVDDAVWPRPVWGEGMRSAYTSAARAARLHALRRIPGLAPAV